MSTSTHGEVTVVFVPVSLFNIASTDTIRATNAPGTVTIQGALGDIETLLETGQWTYRRKVTFGEGIYRIDSRRHLYFDGHRWHLPNSVPVPFDFYTDLSKELIIATAPTGMTQRTATQLAAAMDAILVP